MTSIRQASIPAHHSKAPVTQAALREMATDSAVFFMQDTGHGTRMGKIRIVVNLKTQGNIMSSPTSPPEAPEADAVEAVVPFMPLVLPLAGAVLMFLLAFIAVSMA